MTLFSRLAAGETLFSAWSGVPDALTVEIVAQQGFDVVTLDIHQRKWRGITKIDFAIGDLYLAGCAQTVAAGVGQIHPRTQCRIKDRLPLLHLDGST